MGRAPFILLKRNSPLPIMNNRGIMTTKETILVTELLEACCAALAFIEQAGPENYILGEDRHIKEMLTDTIEDVHRFYEEDLSNSH